MIAVEIKLGKSKENRNNWGLMHCSGSWRSNIYQKLLKLKLHLHHGHCDNCRLNLKQTTLQSNHVSCTSISFLMVKAKPIDKNTNQLNSLKGRDLIHNSRLVLHV